MTPTCRCGYDGNGIHRCHAGRPDPMTGEDGSRHCPRPAEPRLHATMGALSGMQIKASCVQSCYCAEHFAEFIGGGS